MVLPFRLLLVLKVRGRLWGCATSVQGVSKPSAAFGAGFLKREACFDSRHPGMKEGCSGENVLERER